MTLFWFALGLFLLSHVIPAVPGVRRSLIAALGHSLYITLYSTLSILLLALLVYATLQLDYVPLWSPEPWQAWVTLILTPIGLFLLLAGLFSQNPLSVSARRASHSPGAIVAVTRHPVLWGFMLWAGSHLVPNGDLRAVLLFGSLFVFALVGMPLVDRRAKKRLGPEWAVRAGTTSIVPFVAIARGRAALRIDAIMALALAVTIVATAWLLSGGHAALFGVDPLALALA